MENAGYQNYYNDVDGALNKTIRYRQMIGLLTSSSIRCFRAQQPNSTVTTNVAECQQAKGAASESLSDKATSHCGMHEANSTSMHDSTVSRRNKTLTSSVSNLTGDITSTLHRQSKNKHVPIAVDVIQYMFHNNHHSEIDIVKNEETSSLSSMKLQEKQRTAPSNFKIQHHHPGYIPTKLWQIFHENEQCDKSQSLSRSVSHVTNRNGNEKCAAAKRGTLQFMPSCFDCGGVIQPGVMNTTIRLVQLNRKVNATDEVTKEKTAEASNVLSNLSRTQRRRESRFKAKLCRKEYYGAKQQQQQITNYKVHTHTSNHKSLQPQAKSKLWQYIWQQQNKYYHNRQRTTGEICKSAYPFLNCCMQYFIVTCGSCGAQIFLPDQHDNNAISFNIRNKKNIQRNRSVGQNRKSETGTKNETSQILSPSSNNSGEMVSTNTDKSQIFCEENNKIDDPASFNPSVRSLPSNSSTATINSRSPTIGVKRKELDVQRRVQSQALDLATVQPTATVLLHQQQKKKKSKNVQGKNDLMAFLSSLNDR
jgi:hypothetical protein